MHNGLGEKKQSKEYPTNRNPAQSLQENAITIFGPRMYNARPKCPKYTMSKCLRVIKSVKTEKFTFDIDKFQELIPDTPKVTNYVTAAGNNSILHQLSHHKAQEIHNGGDVSKEHLMSPTRPWSRFNCNETSAK